MNTNINTAAITATQLAEACDWASDCLGLSSGDTVSAERAVRYVERNYDGGWSAFAEACAY